MLLGLMRKHASSWIIKVIMMVIVLVFIFYFGYSFRASRGLKVAEVNGDVISRYEYSKAYRDLYEAFRRQYKDLWTDKMVKLFHLKELVLNRLINERLINDEAKKLGFSVTDSEIQKAILKIKAFNVNGHFDMQRYKAMLSSNRITPEEFEQSIAKDILSKKLRQFIFTFVHLTDQEVRDHYAFLTEQIKLAFVRFLPESFRDRIKITPSDLKQFFEKNKERYKTPTKIKLTYIVIDPKDFTDKVKIRKDDITAYYETHKDQFKKSGSDDLKPLKEVKKEITEVLVKQAATDMAQEQGLSLLDHMPYNADIAKYAADNNLKTGSTDFFSIKEPIPGIGNDKRIKDKLFSLNKKDTTDLITLNGKFYIFQVMDKHIPRIPSLNEVMDRVKEDCIRKKALDRAKQEAEAFLERLKKGEKWDALIKEYHLKPVETPFFTRQGHVPGVAADPALNEKLFSLSKDRRFISKPYVNHRGAFIFRWLASKGMNEEKFEKDKKQFTNMLIDQKRKFVFEKWLLNVRRISDIKILVPVSEL